jgi:hypothetical protein
MAGREIKWSGRGVECGEVMWSGRMWRSGGVGGNVKEVKLGWCGEWAAAIGG